MPRLSTNIAPNAIHGSSILIFLSDPLWRIEHDNLHLFGAVKYASPTSLGTAYYSPRQFIRLCKFMRDEFKILTPLNDLVEIFSSAKAQNAIKSRKRWNRLDRLRDAIKYSN